MKRIQFFVLFVFCVKCHLNSTAQVASDLGNVPSIKSPNTAALGTFGDIQVSPFNGLVQIEIPIVNVKYRDIDVPIYLSYNSSGNRPDNHPGWAGLGWTLNEGGIITRHANGYCDEIGNGIGYSYYDQYSLLANNNWNTVDFMSNPGAPDLAPDEFSFSINGISGCFMLNHEGKWVVKSKDKSFVKVEHEIQTNYTLQGPEGLSQNLQRCFVKFTLTTGDGTKYVFGGAPNAIEFSRPALPFRIENYNATTPPGPGRIIPYLNQSYVFKNVQPSAWHLTEIISPTGTSVKYYYTTALGFQQNTYTSIAKFITVNSRPHYTYDINQNMQYLVNTAYLDKIVLGNGFTYQFYKSPSNELAFQFKTKPDSQDSFGPYYYFGQSPPSPFGATFTGQFLKLDSLCVRDSEGILQNKIAFSYRESPSERLKLTQVNYLSSRRELVNNYKIEYNSKLLPAYNTGMEDHWGYYNGRNYWGTLSVQAQTPVPNLTAYFQSREVDTAYMDAEMLKKITYPTGGYSEFTFEPNDYSSLVEQSPTMSLVSQSANKLAGGLRIKKVISADGAGNTLGTREFFYNRDYLHGGSLSSGILSGTPKYYETGSANGNSFERFFSMPLSHMNTTNGNHITYTEVTERVGDNGYIVRKYTNHDNGYLDKNPFTIFLNATAGTIGEKKLFGKLELERGLPLNVVYYDSSRTIKRKEAFEYNNTASRYDNYVRSVQFTETSMNFVLNMAAYPIYTFYPYLMKETIVEYATQTADSLLTVKEYEYDNAFKLLKTILSKSSRQINEATKLRYPIDVIASNEDPTGVYLNMRNKGMTSYIIESKSLVGESEVKLLKTNYYSPSSNVFVPQTIQEKNFDNPLETRVTFENYDVHGNVRQTRKANDIPVAYIWGYNKIYPIAECTNATYDEVAYTGFEGGYDGEKWDSPTTWSVATATDAPSGKNYLSFHDLTGVFSANVNLNPAKTYIFSCWEKGVPIDEIYASGIHVISDKILRTNGAWRLREIVFNNVTGPVDVFGGLSGDCFLDDLCIYPLDAQMTTYTYDPLVGMTSRTESNGVITRFEYDNFGRLKLIRDMDGKILKQYNYQYNISATQ